MKKIICLTLSLIMILGLATTAFAAKMGTNFNNAKNDSDWNYIIEINDAEDSKNETFATYEIEAIAKRNNAKAWWATLTDVKKDDDFTLGKNFIKVASEEYSTLTLIDDKTVTYFLDIDELNWAGKAVKVTLPNKPFDKADLKCNTLYSTSSENVFYYFDNMLWVSVEDLNDTEVILNVNGIAVFATKVTDEIYEHFHNLTVKYINHTSTDNVIPTKVYCQNCKAEFKFVYGTEKDAINTFGVDNYETKPIDISIEGIPVWVELITPTIPGITSNTDSFISNDKVESPQTFDAGIAGYVALTLASTTGMAWVAKKKEN